MENSVEFDLRNTLYSDDSETSDQSSEFINQTTNDPGFSQLWGLSKINATNVWSDVASKESVVVAVLDTGVDYNHVDLKGNVWTNPGEIAGDGLDNDGNGYIDDVYGWDFRNDDNDPSDDNSHGTHVAGTIAAVANNNIGVAGVNPYAEILPLKFMGDTGSGSSSHAIKAIEYAVALKKAYDTDHSKGANIRVINMSFGGGTYNAAFDGAIQEAAKVGILIVAAAGNNGTNNDAVPFYPASYPAFSLSYFTGTYSTDNILSVAASGSSDGKESYSNYGAKTVDVAAPGGGIYSTLPNSSYGSKSGTSMAAPHAAGAASLLFAYKPELTPIDVKQILIDSADYSSAFNNIVVSDGRINLDKAFVLVKNWDSNNAPIAISDSYTVAKNSVTNITASQGVLSNDSDADGDKLTATIVPEYLQGFITVNEDGSFKYTAPKDFIGVDDFHYKITDGKGKTSIGKVTVNIVNSVVNNNPVATNDSYTVHEDTTLTGNILSNDSDVDGDSLTASVINNVTKGTLSLNSNGSFSYTPNLNYFGTDSFTYQVSDGKGGTTNATVSLTINPINDIPLATNDSYTVDEDTTLTGNILSNDSDVDGDSLTASVINNVTKGTLSLNSNGSFSYTPNLNYFGTDSFTYQVSDGKGGTTNATVSLTINPINDIPLATNDSYTVDEDTTLTGNILSNDSDVDGDSLTASVINNVTKGTLSLNSNGSFSYIPSLNYFGTDSFTYQVSDGKGGTTNATVSLTINPINDIPLATNDSYTVDEDTTLTGNILSNDSDVDGDSLTASVINNVTKGTLSLNSNGSFSYTPNLNYFGTDSFTYQVSDGKGGTTNATVSLTINPINDIPLATNDSYTVDEDTTLTGNILSNDSDVDGDSLTASVINNVTKGTLSLNSNGSFSYTPNLNYFGTDSFTYQVSDGKGGTTNATVSLTINPINDIPLATNDSYTVDEDTTLTGNILSNDSDVDGDSLTASVINNVTKGTLSLNSNGSFSYIPNLNYFGTDSFTYQVSDGKGGTTNATVSLTINQNYSITNTLKIGLQSYVVESYDKSQDFGNASVNQNNELTLTGNAWKRINFQNTITSNSFLTFEFKSDVEGEIQGIGFDTDNFSANSGSTTFKLFGNTDWGLLKYDNYNVGSGWKQYSIPVGQFFTGTFQYLTFVSDDDRSTPVGVSQFRNIQIVEVVNQSPIAVNDNLSTNANSSLTFSSSSLLSNDSDPDGDSLTLNSVTALSTTKGSIGKNSDGTYTYNPNGQFNQLTTGQTATDSFTYTISDGKGKTATATVNVIISGVSSGSSGSTVVFNGQNYLVEKYDKSQDFGNASVNSKGELMLTGNAWKNIDLTGIGGITLDSDSILAFDFKSDVQAEMQGIGFDNDKFMNNSANTNFELTGIQKWGVQQYYNYSIGSGWKHYEIPVGKLFTGTFNYLTFFNDDDRANPIGVSEFRNLELF